MPIHSFSTLYTLPRFLPSLSLYSLPRSLSDQASPLSPAFHHSHSPYLVSISLTLHQSSLLLAVIDYSYVALLWYLSWFWLILGCVLCEILIILLKLKSCKFTNQDENFFVFYMLQWWWSKLFLAIWLCLCYFLINENFVVFYMLHWLFSH